MNPKIVTNRFHLFNPDEREILRILIEGHVNTVSAVALSQEGVRVGAYLAALEALEYEMNNCEDFLV